MALSPNYNWSEPDNSSLVKDGAQAMRTLGDAIDTSVWNVGFGQAGKNKIINGAFQVWQRGTSFTNASGGVNIYSADRWQIYRGATGSTYSRQNTNDTTNLPFIQYAIRCQRDSGDSATNPLYLAQSIESANSTFFAGKSITFSFYARAGANYSAASSSLGFTVSTGTGTDQNIISGFTGNANIINSTATLTTTWQRFTATATVSSSATQLGFYFASTPVGTAGANDYFEITGVQLEAGSVATPFQTASGGSIQGELAMCQRYYVRYGGSSFSLFAPSAWAVSTTLPQCYVTFPVQMRTAPSALDYAGTIQFYDTGNAGYNLSALVIDSGLNGNKTTGLNGTGTGLTQGRFGVLRANSDANAYVGFSAEL